MNLFSELKTSWMSVLQLNHIGKAEERVAKTNSPVFNPDKVSLNSCFACRVIAAARSQLIQKDETDVAPGSINRQIMTLYLNGFMSFYFLFLLKHQGHFCYNTHKCLNMCASPSPKPGKMRKWHRSQLICIVIASH